MNEEDSLARKRTVLMNSAGSAPRCKAIVSAARVRNSGESNQPALMS
jgi:tetratricopeptide (TPR) repeat protein